VIDVTLVTFAVTVIAALALIVPTVALTVPVPAVTAVKDVEAPEVGEKVPSVDVQAGLTVTAFPKESLPVAVKACLPPMARVTGPAGVSVIVANAAAATVSVFVPLV
jgi:hypothetical protein